MYQEAQPTIAFQHYVDRFIFGTALSRTLNEQKQYAANTNPTKGETMAEAIQRLPQGLQPALHEERWLTAHYFHSEDWYTDDAQVWEQAANRKTGVELIFAIRITQISAKRIEIQVPELAFYIGRTRTPFRMDLTLADLLTYSKSKLKMQRLSPWQTELLDNKQPLKTIKTMILASKGLSAAPRT
jgi:hypothetical protein